MRTGFDVPDSWLWPLCAGSVRNGKPLASEIRKKLGQITSSMYYPKLRLHAKLFNHGEYRPTDREAKILELLKDKPKKLDQLSQLLGVSRTTLSSRELKRLKNAGKVRHVKGKGFISTDQPPDE